MMPLNMCRSRALVGVCVMGHSGGSGRLRRSEAKGRLPLVRLKIAWCDGMVNERVDAREGS
jgi:hypothetical protein